MISLVVTPDAAMENSQVIRHDPVAVTSNGLWSVEVWSGWIPSDAACSLGMKKADAVWPGSTAKRKDYIQP